VLVILKFEANMVCVRIATHLMSTQINTKDKVQHIKRNINMCREKGEIEIVLNITQACENERGKCFVKQRFE